MKSMRSRGIQMVFFVSATMLSSLDLVANETLLAGAAKVDITDRDAGSVHDPLFAKALVLKVDHETAVLITVDAVAIGEIGHIGNDYLPAVRKQLLSEFNIDPKRVLANASHCHGVVCDDVLEKTIEAVRQAHARLEPVRLGVGTGHENEIMENRRLILKSGGTVDVRHAYSLPANEEVAEVGPVDPQIGLLRLDRLDGSTLAVIFNFACHPIQGVPGGRNTADLSGIAGTIIEENLGPDAIALFVQGCGGDINPVNYKDVDHPRSAVPLGQSLALNSLRALRKIECRPDKRLAVLHQTLTLPRADRTQRILELETEQERLISSLRGTSLNLETFMQLMVKYNLAGDFPSGFSHRYLREDAIAKDDLRQLDIENLRNMKAYLENIHTMEALTRLRTNLNLLRRHQLELEESGKRTIDVEMVGLRVGDFVLLTFPGELTVQIGLNLKTQSPHKPTFVAGYTNGYIYYAPTAEQLKNVGGAQEDSDCILAPDWQLQFERAALDLLKRL
ncbi:MAG: hypothetical protein VX668_02625 [Planctomycetota bacterium]|nr:hypothetical protein [Planctomycetota bacterium]